MVSHTKTTEEHGTDNITVLVLSDRLRTGIWVASPVEGDSDAVPTVTLR